MYKATVEKGFDFEKLVEAKRVTTEELNEEDTIIA